MRFNLRHNTDLKAGSSTQLAWLGGGELPRGFLFFFHLGWGAGINWSIPTCNKNQVHGHIQRAPMSGSQPSDPLDGTDSACPFLLCFVSFLPFLKSTFRSAILVDDLPFTAPQYALCFFLDPQEQSLFLGIFLPFSLELLSSWVCLVRLLDETCSLVFVTGSSLYCSQLPSTPSPWHSKNYEDWIRKCKNNTEYLEKQDLLRWVT